MLIGFLNCCRCVATPSRRFRRPQALDLLGFTWAEDKRGPLSHEAELLGVKVDLGCFGVVKIGNKPDRAESIAAGVDSVLDAGSLDPKILPRIQFAEGQLHGRLGRLALADLRACAMRSQSQFLDPTARQALVNLRARVLGGTPRIVPAVVGDRKSVVFTNGAGACRQSASRHRGKGHVSL